MRTPTHRLHSAALGALVLVAALVVATPASGQYAGANFHGDLGVNSGTQPPPGMFLILPYAQWHVNELRNESGDKFLPNQFKGFDLRVAVPTLVVVTKEKILGGNYGFMVAAPFSKIRPERVTDAGTGDWGFADMYVVPVYLGWRIPHADFVAGYGFYAPTGKYEAGASDNVGLGMWSHELQGGMTVYMDTTRKLSFATTAFFEMHGKKKDQDIRVGNLLTLEGGAAYNVPKIGGAFGVAYYFQNKLSDDKGADVPVTLLRALDLYGRSNILGIGPDVSMGLFQRGTTVGAVNVRYLWDVTAKNSFKGNTLWVSFTLGKVSM